MTQALRIPILLTERVGRDRDGEPLRLGIPLPKGLLHDPAVVVVDGDGRALPTQSRPLAAWPDRSVKWLLVDLLATVRAHERATLFLCSTSDAQAVPTRDSGCLRVSDHGQVLEVDTGAAVFEVGGQPGALLGAVRVRGADVLGPAGARVSLKGCTGRPYRAVATRTHVEEQGPVRAAIVVQGHFQPLERGAAPPSSPLAFKSRIIFTAGSSCLRIEFLLHNPQAASHPGGLWDLDDRGTLLFEDLSLVLTPAGAARELRWYAERPAEMRADAPDDWSLYQDSSGGESWDSDNHIDGKGRLSVTFRGYRVRCSCVSGPVLIAEGDRATPCLMIEMPAGSIAATAFEFWENFPKALRWADGALSVGIFPEECHAPFALQGGEQKRHTVLLDFPAPGVESSIPALQQPLDAAVDPSWVERSGAIHSFVAASRDGNREYLRYIDAIIAGPHAFEAKRERIDEFGWRHYGDLYADHEAVGNQGTRPLISHYNNQYDFVQGGLIHFLRTGDHRWWRLADAAARHTIDIDIYHTDRDKAAFNHGLFWHTDHYKPARTSTHRTYSRRNGSSRAYGGGPSNEHNYTSGLVLYFYLSGDPEAAAAVRELADWVIAMDDGARSILGLIDPGPTGLASKTVDPTYHKAGRGAGNSINALLDAWQLSGERRYLDKAEELIHRCIHPADDIDALHLTEPELRWSYLVFLQVLGKYLHLKVEWSEIDYKFHYARASLLHYARWMAAHETPYRDVLHKVELPTETWPAHDMRKCHVLHLAAEYAPVAERASLHERAAFFFERSLADVLSFETAFLTRPLVILCVCGYAHAYYEHHADIGVQAEGAPPSFGEPEVFTPQRSRWRTALPTRARLLLTHLVRAGVERLDILGRHSTPSRL